MSQFVDTNIFIRLLAQDDPGKTQRCLSLFERAERSETHLVTSESVIAEVVYVLSSQALYRLARQEIATILRPILEIRGLRLEHKQSFLVALDIYENSSLDFEDCLSVAHMGRLGLGDIISYDHDFDSIVTVTRVEP